jgi:hypothetical protein
MWWWEAAGRGKARAEVVAEWVLELRGGLCLPEEPPSHLSRAADAREHTTPEASCWTISDSQIGLCNYIVGCLSSELLTGSLSETLVILFCLSLSVFSLLS